MLKTIFILIINAEKPFLTNEDTSAVFISDSIPQYYSEYSYSSKKFIINCTMHHAVKKHSGFSIYFRTKSEYLHYAF